EISDFMATQIMPETPIQATMILFLGIVVIGVRLGLETIARTAEIFLPWIIMLFFIMVLFLLPDIQIEKIQPVLEEGIKPVLRASYTFVAIPFMELAAFLMILPYVNEKHKLTKNFYFAAWIGGMVTIVTTVLCILVLGAEVTTRSSYASYVLAKKISIGDFLERLEVIIAIIWLLTIFFKLAICFYGVALGLAQMLKLKDYRPLLLPLAMILVVLSIIITPNVIHYNFFTARIWPLQDLAFGCLLPLLLLSVDVIRKRKKKLMNNK
ncbi:MAG TPA: endospore germination permease, partial [Bacilli bacterium]